MNEMRMFANLILASRQQSENQNASGIDILDFSKFDNLDKVILQLSEGSTKQFLQQQKEVQLNAGIVCVKDGLNPTPVVRWSYLQNGKKYVPSQKTISDLCLS